MTASPALVTACIPVYNGARFIGETLESLQGQSYPDFRARISVDPSSDDSAAVCRRWLRDPRFELCEQPHRSGWVDNCNWLLARVRSPYCFLLPHDDLLEPRFLERMLESARANPQAAVVYPDIQTFGRIDNLIIAQESIRGSLVGRLRLFLTEHYNAVAFRGLIGLETLSRAGLLQHNPWADFSEDTVWLMKLVRHGELIRVPEPLYRKRYHPHSEHAAWLDRDRAERIQVWSHHCLELAAQALDPDLPAHQQSMLLQAALERLLGLGAKLAPFSEIGQLSESERQLLVTAFCQGLAEQLGADRLEALWSSVRELGGGEPLGAAAAGRDQPSSDAPSGGLRGGGSMRPDGR